MQPDQNKPIYTIHLEFFTRSEVVEYLQDRYPGIILWETGTGYDAMMPYNGGCLLFPIEFDDIADQYGAT